MTGIEIMAAVNIGFILAALGWLAWMAFGPIK